MGKLVKILSIIFVGLPRNLLSTRGRFLALACLTICLNSHANHVRTGEITYRHISGYTYEFTVTMFFNYSSVASLQGQSLQISWGDFQTDRIPRISYEILPDDIVKSVYRMQKTFPGQGIYTVILEDMDRRNFINYQNTQSFSIKTIIRIDPNLGHRNSPHFNAYPLGNATAWQRFVYNSFAEFTGGDSLTYELVVPTGTKGIEVETYSLPQASNELYIDRVTGDLVWDTPMVTGDYVIAIRVNKWRRGIIVSRVTREIVIVVSQNENILMWSDILPSENAIYVYPNPANEIINFKLDKETIVQIHDLSGRLLQSQKLPSGDVVLNISHLPAGIYFLKIENQAVKFIKK